MDGRGSPLRDFKVSALKPIFISHTGKQACPTKSSLLLESLSHASSLNIAISGTTKKTHTHTHTRTQQPFNNIMYITKKNFEIHQTRPKGWIGNLFVIYDKNVMLCSNPKQCVRLLGHISNFALEVLMGL